MFREQLDGGTIDAAPSPAEDGLMSHATYTTPRRSARVFHRMRIQAQGRGHDGRKFREVCETVVVSVHGGLIYLKHEVKNGEILVLVNPETQDELECRVVFLGDAAEKGQRVGVEFLTPAPRFWGIDFEAPPSSPGDGLFGRTKVPEATS